MGEQIGNKIPQVRFKKFKKGWVEEPILSRITNIVDFRGRTPKKLGLDWSKSGYLALSAQNVKDDYIDRSTEAHFGNEELYDAWMKGNELHYNQVLFTTEAPMGNVAQIPDFEKYILSQRTIAFVTDPRRLSEDYLAALLKSPSVFKQLLARSSGGTAKGISQKSLSSLNVSLADDLEEQTQIGSYFKLLNQLLALYQRRCDKLAILKRTMLKQMFPRCGVSIPEIRFRGFTGDWEVKKLGDITLSLPNNSLSRADLNDKVGLAKNVHYGDILVKFGEVIDVDESDLPFISNPLSIAKLEPSKLDDGDVVVADAAEDSSVGKCAEILNVGDNLVFPGLHTIALRPTISFAPAYLGYFMNSRSFHDQLLPIMQGTKVLSISKRTLRETYILYPKDVREQQRIGTYFRKLDALISQHATQLEKLKQIKLACFEKMFV